ncbi:hypothetical protein BKA93DRAFT_877495 [Sparassis latifolia]
MHGLPQTLGSANSPPIERSNVVGPVHPLCKLRRSGHNKPGNVRRCDRPTAARNTGMSASPFAVLVALAVSAGLVRVGIEVQMHHVAIYEALAELPLRILLLILQRLCRDRNLPETCSMERRRAAENLATIERVCYLLDVGFEIANI